MNEHAVKMLNVESAYLSGVEGKLESAKGKHFQGSIWKTARTDDSDRLRAVMARHRVYDRERLRELPHNRSISLQGFERTWWFGRRPTGVVVATVLSPFDELVTGAEPEPIDLPELQDHVRKIVGDGAVEHVIGVCAPSGFTESARKMKMDLPRVALVLIESAAGGGWRVSSPDADLPKAVLDLFDPEGDSEKIERVRSELASRSADLLTSGLTASSLARSLGLPESLVKRAIEKLAATDPSLRVTRKSEDLLLYRGAASHQAGNRTMNVVDRIKQLFAKEGGEAEKINVLAERRAQLAQRRDQLYEDIAKLETKEADLLRQGRENSSQIVRKRLAAQLGQLRKDIGRQNTTANMLNKQINIISTDIHNLTLIQQGNMAQLPSTEELTENAVQAEEMLESLQVDSELIGQLEAGVSDVAVNEEELAILREFDAPESESIAQESSSPARPAKESQPARKAVDTPQETAFNTPEPPPDEPGESRSRANPEAT